MENAYSILGPYTRAATREVGAAFPQTAIPHLAEAF
jgi:hypothetical protein